MYIYIYVVCVATYNTVNLMVGIRLSMVRNTVNVQEVLKCVFIKKKTKKTQSVCHLCTKESSSNI